MGKQLRQQVQALSASASQLAQITAAEQALGAARDAPGASAALAKMSVSLDEMIQRIDTLPPCCTEGICCHVGIQ